MGKASRKLKKKQLQEETAGRQAEAQEIEATLLRQIEEGAYSEALETLAKLAEKKAVTPQAMCAGAYAYFMLGDYERAAIWIDNTLQFDSSHVAARILLARLCILQEKVEEGLSIFNLLADKFLPAMSEEEQDEMESLAGFYGRNEPKQMMEKYPALAKFLKLDEAASEKGPTEPEEPAVHAGPVLRLRPQPMTEAAAEPETRQEVLPEAKTEPPKASGESALEILRKLRAKIDERTKKEGSGGVGASPAVQTATESLPQESKPQETPAQENLGDAQAKLREVLDGKRSLIEKVQILASFAGGYFAQGDLAASELFLTEALKIDETDEGLIRNLAVLLAAKGEKEKAFQAAARMEQADFLLLDAIRRM